MQLCSGTTARWLSQSIGSAAGVDLAESTIEGGAYGIVESVYCVDVLADDPASSKMGPCAYSEQKEMGGSVRVF